VKPLRAVREVQLQEDLDEVGRSRFLKRSLGWLVLGPIAGGSTTPQVPERDADYLNTRTVCGRPLGRCGLSVRLDPARSERNARTGVAGLCSGKPPDERGDDLSSRRRVHPSRCGATVDNPLGLPAVARSGRERPAFAWNHERRLVRPAAPVAPKLALFREPLRIVSHLSVTAEVTIRT
jgi:hypothetical protein